MPNADQSQASRRLTNSWRCTKRACNGQCPISIGYRALAGYRFGAISCFNVMLHRRGKRHDPEWDLIAPSVKTLFGRAKELLLSR